MKWCCGSFKDNYEQRYDRTIFVFSSPPVYDRPHADFWIGMRCVEQKELKKKPVTVAHEGVAITISTCLPIHYCPWCGKNLREHYGNNPTHLFDDVIIKEFVAWAM